MKLNKYWFRQKKYGYGVVPHTWEGWAVLGAFFIFVICVSIIFLERFFYLYLFLILASPIYLIFLAKKRTKGEWGWHWGDR